MRALTLLLLLMGAAHANPKADVLLDTIDVYLTEANMAAVGLNAAYAEQLLLDGAQRRYRRIRAMGALTILAPERAFEVLPQRLKADEDKEIRIQAAIHLNRAFGLTREVEVRRIFEEITRRGELKLNRIISGELRRLEIRRAALNAPTR